MTAPRAARLIVTLGDPRGIGPEVSVRAARRLRAAHPDMGIRFVGHLPADEALPHGVEHIDVGSFDGSEPSAGRIAGRAIEEAVAALLRQEGDALVTAPIHKPGLRAAGYPEPGHTELLQRLTDAPEVGMLMAAETTRLGAPLRVLLATTHIALRDVPTACTEDLLVRRTRLLAEALRDRWGIERPHVALCALNPHASDGGLFGDEEARVQRPARERLEAEGWQVAGPLPADTVFSRALAGEFDAVVAPYHDVGMAAFKTVSFGSGVNVTLGLPFVRTSPDHGTAFDIAGTGRASEASMLEAMELALRLARPQAGA